MHEITSGPIYERCRQALDEHFDRYFRQRDVKASLAQYHRNAVGIGTGRGENGMTPAQMREVIINDLNGYTRPVDTHIKSRTFHQVTEEVVISQIIQDITLETNTHRMTLRDNRHTLVWHLPPEGEPSICHVHVSVPTDLHGEEEAYPLKELEEVSQMVDTLINDRTQSLTESYRRLEQMVVRDRLTGMFNRVRLDEVLEQELIRANRYDRPFSLVFLDLDHFKEVNDTHGHLAGDHILKRLAAIIQEEIRITDTAGRWGGEEFLIILPETNPEEAVQVAEKLRRQIEKASFSVNGQTINVTVSLGVGTFQEGDETEEVLHRTDQALYQAKAAGRNQTVVNAQSTAETETS